MNDRWVLCEKESHGKVPATLKMVDPREVDEIRENLTKHDRIVFLVTWEKFCNMVRDANEEEG